MNEKWSKSKEASGEAQCLVQELCELKKSWVRLDFAGRELVRSFARLCLSYYCQLCCKRFSACVDCRAGGIDDVGKTFSLQCVYVSQCWLQKSHWFFFQNFPLFAAAAAGRV